MKHEREQDRGPGSRRRNGVRYFFGVAMGLLLLAFFCWHARRDYERTLEDERGRLEALAVALAGNADVALRGGGYVLRSVELAMRQAGGVAKLSPDQLAGLFRRHLDSVPTVDGSPFHAMWMADAEGQVLAHTNENKGARANVADREYFVHHRSVKGADSYLSPLTVERLGGNQVIFQTVRLEDAEGRFAGILGISLRVKYLDKLYRMLRLEEGSTVLLLRMDGQLLFRYPLEPHHVLVGPKDMRHYQDVIQLKQGSFETERSAYDGLARVAGFTRSDYLPLVALVSQTRDRTLAQWRANTITYALIALSIYLMLLGLFLHSQRQWRRLDSSIQASLHDALTGLPNRRYLDRMLPIEWRRSGRGQQCFSALFIDIDHFKRFNDRYGHAAGDACLRQVAECMRTALQRPGDALIRYGGEEFLCLLPDTDAAGARKVAEGLLDAVRALALRHEDSPTAQIVTLSIGVATGRPLDGSPEALLREADAALYAAKSSGRDRVVEGGDAG
ncbi:sensor domain-containing diguanylate cyclase [Pelomonas sp. SE-A7]|uniref:GGDEF domain-containing protein n=1 Tax=Pelomonas sp. SE-A7 TaxID=3054953 RepID=UPI00259C7062|nr:sensor domain-containing diguanylate cyclase [Pelomonas sp. SE-A7]MDM4765773.1 sensor domain-containing diguanylate cyclase [Pelomonas sp. SE-A7]